jgi:serine/threonine protein kinase
MNTAPELSLYDALLQSGRLSADQRAAVERLFATHAADPARLADELLAAKLITKYMHRKIQLGKPGELVFGQYLILERIGEGGMGKVYRAIGTRMGLEVALKTIRPNLLTNRTVVQRYKREARAAASLIHPNIVKLYEADDVGGRYFLAMEFVDGSDLSRLVKDLNKEKVSMPPGEAAEYIRQAALGLQHAHDMGLVHRDVKPSNLLVSGERAIPGTGGKASVKILDMGLVRSIIDDDASTTDLTRDGTVVGTPDYMSPEQSRNSSTVDPRADIYSLGCTLFFLLRGVPPYDSGTAIDKLIKHQLDPVPDIRQYRPDVPPGLASVIKKMMAKRPDDRYATAEEASRALAHYTGDPTTAPPPDHDSVAGIPSLDALETLPAAPASGGYQIDFAPVTPAPTTTPPAANPPAHPVPLPAAPVMAGESGVRSVRMVRPVAPPPTGQRSVRVLVAQAKPIAKPPADATPSGDVDTPSRARRTDSGGAGSAARRPARRPPPKKAKGGFPVVAVAAVGVAVVALLVVLAVLIALAGKGEKAAPTTAAPPPAPAPQAKSPFRPTAELLPDGTAAVLVADPKTYWATAEADHPFGSRVRRNTEFLTRGFGFDPRRFDRVTVAFQPDMSKCVAAGEGEVLAGDAFRKDLDRLQWADVEKGANGVLLVVRGKKDGKANPFNADRRVQGALLPTPAAYLIGSDEADLGKLSKSAATRTPAGLDPPLADAVTAVTHSTDTPLVFFAASGGCRLPFAKGATEPLSAHGVELLTLSGAAAADKRVRLTLAAVGPDARRLNRFVEMELPALLETLVGKELAKPLADPITEAVVAAVPADVVGGRKRLTVEFTWEWAAVHPVAEKLIPLPLDRKD